MATPALTKDEWKIVISAIETLERSQKVSQARNKNPIMETAFTQFLSVLSQLKAKCAGQM